MPQPRVTIVNQTRRAVDTAQLRRQLAAALRLLKVRTGEWTLSLVNDRAMAALHDRTMNLPTTTDVLTFDLRTNGKGPLELDTVICVDEAARRARELGHRVADELLLYAIHSLLHVQGYDDLRPAEAARMHRREDEILVALGRGPVFAAPVEGRTRRSARAPAGTVRS